jgi:hypothetical protein
MATTLRSVLAAVLGLTAAVVGATPALAADAATIVFNSGQRVYINNGYGQIVTAMKQLNARSQDHQIVDLNIEGGSFLLNVAEVVIVCRDRCTSLEVVDFRDPSRAPRQY